MEINITHQQTDSKGEFFVENQGEKLATMTYSKAGKHMIIIDHTEVSDQLRGLGVGNKLVLAAVDYARAQKIRILPLCPFAKSVFDKMEEIRDVLA
ncbi:MAG: GNAT family N-acetyltransferase [Flammeovirgaceae bacterium]